jgi:hypothetical protein
MESQQMMELLLAIKASREESKTYQAKLEAWRDEMRADREEMLSKMDEWIAAIQGKTDVKLEELTESREEMMQSAEEHHEVPDEDAVEAPVSRYVIKDYMYNSMIRTS